MGALFRMAHSPPVTSLSPHSYGSRVVRYSLRLLVRTFNARLTSNAISIFQRQARPAAGTVIDAKDLPHVTVGRAAGILLRQLGNGLGVGPCQLLHQTLPAVLLVELVCCFDAVDFQ